MTNKKLVAFLNVLVNIIWWTLLPLFSILFLLVLVKLSFTGEVDWTIPTYIYPDNFNFSITPSNPSFQFKSISGMEGKLVINSKLTPMLIVAAMGLVVSTFLLILAGVFNLRKIFRSLRSGEPFSYGNFTRLKRIGYFTISLAIVDFGASLFNRYLLKENFLSYGKYYSAKLSFGIDSIISGLIILVLAEIFKYGYKLKTENEAFI